MFPFILGRPAFLDWNTLWAGLRPEQGCCICPDRVLGDVKDLDDS